MQLASFVDEDLELVDVGAGAGAMLTIGQKRGGGGGSDRLEPGVNVSRKGLQSAFSLADVPDVGNDVLDRADECDIVRTVAKDQAVVVAFHLRLGIDERRVARCPAP